MGAGAGVGAAAAVLALWDRTTAMLGTLGGGTTLTLALLTGVVGFFLGEWIHDFIARFLVAPGRVVDELVEKYESGRSRPYVEAVRAYDIGEDGAIGSFGILVARADGQRMEGVRVHVHVGDWEHPDRGLDLVPDGTGLARGEVPVNPGMRMTASPELVVHGELRHAEWSLPFSYKCLPARPWHRTNFVRSDDDTRAVAHLRIGTGTVAGTAFTAAVAGRIAAGSEET